MCSITSKVARQPQNAQNTPLPFLFPLGISEVCSVFTILNLKTAFRAEDVRHKRAGEVFGNPAVLASQHFPENKPDKPSVFTTRNHFRAEGRIAG